MAAALVSLALAGGGCTRLDALNRRLEAIDDATARTIVRDALWAHGAKYGWAEHAALRAEVTRTVRRPLGDSATDEVWLLDLWSGALRIEAPAYRRVTVYDGQAWRVFIDGRETADLEARAQAAGDARLVAGLLPMPLSLTAPGQRVAFAGTRTGPGEARTWQRLLVTYPDGAGTGDEAVVEVRQDSHRVEAVLIRWSEPPFVGRPMRVEMDDWRPAGDLLLSRRWRFIPTDDQGAPTGPALYTVRVKRIDLDPPLAAGTFSQP